MKESLNTLTATAKQALLTGGDILRRGFYAARQITYKSATDPVTETDRASERKVISLIRRRFPGHTFLAEESAYLKKGDIGTSQPGQYRWIIDPLDGTVNFIHGIPQFCISVGVECGGTILAGGVYDPLRKELFMATKGKGAHLNGKKIRVSPETKLIRSLLVTGFPYGHQNKSTFHADLLQPFLASMADVRRMGAAALDLSWVACGRFDVYWENGLKPWDVAAGLLLVTEAGGKISDFKGQTLQIDQPARTLATNGRLHPAILKLFKTLRST